MKNIAIIFGGKSVEHDISLITALQAMANMPKKYSIFPVYIKTDGRMVTAENLSEKEIYLNYQKNVKNEREILFLPASGSMAILKKDKIKNKVKIDCALLCLHGHGGEDGSVQGLLELCEIPYTSPSLPSSAMCMDKVLTKIILENAHIRTPAYLHFNRCEYLTNKNEKLKEIDKNLGIPCIVKPASGGSSVGIGICENVQELSVAIDNALEYDNKIIVEEFVANAREFCCAVIKIKGKVFASRVTEVKKGKIFSFEEKYLKERVAGKNQIGKTLDGQIKERAKEVYQILDCDGVVRIDFLLGEELYVNEVNSIPGSLSFNMFDTTFPDLLQVLISEGEERYKEKKNIVYKFSSTAIENFIAMTKNMKFKS